MKNEIGKRMKDYYENRTRTYLPRRTNTIIRIDGKAFHTYTKGLERPFDQELMDDMAETTKFLCKEIQGAKLGYCQSDEISILITDYDKIGTCAWFDGNIQKIVSIAASLATAKFNQLRMIRRMLKIPIDLEMVNEDVVGILEDTKQAMFDARTFTIPHDHEVVNYFIWRQEDATRNSISMAAQSMFSHNKLHGKSTNQMQDMMMVEKSVNWNDYTDRMKRGTLIKRVEKSFGRDVEKNEIFEMKDSANYPLSGQPIQIFKRNVWEIVDVPIFTKDKNCILDVLPEK